MDSVSTQGISTTKQGKGTIFNRKADVFWEDDGILSITGD